MKEEEIKAIRRVFDADYKKLKRLNKRISDQEDSLAILHVSDFHTEDGTCLEYEIADPEVDVEGSVIQGLMLDELAAYLEELDEEDRDLILTYFSFKNKAIKQTADVLGCSEKYVRYKKKKILQYLQKRFSV